jgi:hypothetical protein
MIFQTKSGRIYRLVSTSTTPNHMWVVFTDKPNDVVLRDMMSLDNSLN